ncbi:hypothetical protein INT45_008899 [Circinella minor]|uniref:Uncharacterized protein n=1 Tax=Circinella minor TaxID=1195481 RepID=A0A8H7RY77_9FUNG|nr:hypothetical protein INT45_008899 [Circinella minor]
MFHPSSSSSSTRQHQFKSAFKRIITSSPPDLLHDISGGEEDDEDSLPSLSITPPFFATSSSTNNNIESVLSTTSPSLIKHHHQIAPSSTTITIPSSSSSSIKRNHNNNNNKSYLQQHDKEKRDHQYHLFRTRRKSVQPQRSPTLTAGNQSIVFQLDLESHAFLPPLPPTNTILSTLRKRVVLERKQQQLQVHQKRPRLYKPQQRLVTRIKIPTKKVPPPPSSLPLKQQQQQQQSDSSSLLTELIPSSRSRSQILQQQQHQGEKRSEISSSVSVSSLKSQQQQQHGTGRPARIKGPCQACHESSDGCMRKAFDWPFPSNSIFNDKGRPYVYLCNKCGLRYNKSGGCVCRNCRWVLCKEEKRKALQHITYMRRTRSNGRVDPNDDIVDFVCSPKYWSCGQSWKVGWIPQDNNKNNNNEFDEEGDISMEEDNNNEDQLLQQQ